MESRSIHKRICTANDVDFDDDFLSPKQDDKDANDMILEKELEIALTSKAKEAKEYEAKMIQLLESSSGKKIHFNNVDIHPYHLCKYDTREKCTLARKNLMQVDDSMQGKSDCSENKSEHELPRCPKIHFTPVIDKQTLPELGD